jgi:ribosomal protein S27E
MAWEDPEKPVADLGRQHPEAAGQTRRDQAHRLSWRSLGRPRWGGIFYGLLFAGVPIVIFVGMLSSAHAYRAGTPTTATHVVCIERHNGRHSHQECKATWSLDGQSHTGEIVGATGGDGPVDVHVHGNTAYTAAAAHDMPWVFIAGGAIPVGFAIGYNYRSRRAARKARERALARETEVPEGFRRTGNAHVAMVRCWVCQHEQTVPVSQEGFSCEQCGAHLNRPSAPA